MITIIKNLNNIVQLLTKLLNEICRDSNTLNEPYSQPLVEDKSDKEEKEKVSKEDIIKILNNPEFIKT